MSKGWERHNVCCEQRYKTGSCICDRYEAMRAPTGLPNRPSSTLSERMRATWRAKMFEWKAGDTWGDDWADEVAALERALQYCQDDKEVMQNIIDVHEAAPSPTDKLNQNYEKLGMTSALVLQKKYGRRSVFGYGRE